MQEQNNEQEQNKGPGPGPGPFCLPWVVPGSTATSLLPPHCQLTFKGTGGLGVTTVHRLVRDRVQAGRELQQ